MLEVHGDVIMLERGIWDEPSVADSSQEQPDRWIKMAIHFDNISHIEAPTKNMGACFLFTFGGQCFIINATFEQLSGAYRTYYSNHDRDFDRDFFHLRRQ